MGSIGPTEWLMIGLVVVLIFGAGRIADLGKGLGEGIRNFKKGLKDDSGAPLLGSADAGSSKEQPPADQR